MSNPKRKIVAGDKFGTRTVVREAATRKDYLRVFVCKCECGEVWRYTLTQLNNITNKAKEGADKGCGVCGKTKRSSPKVDAICVWCGDAFQTSTGIPVNRQPVCRQCWNQQTEKGTRA